MPKVSPEQIDQFLDACKQDASQFKQEPGLVSVQLHRGIGKSGVFINYVVWESLRHYKDAFNKVVGENMQSLSKYPDSMIVSPHLFKKVAVPGICGD